MSSNLIDVEISGLTLTGGTTTGNGGAIFIDRENVTLRDLLITGNQASSGGGIWANVFNGSSVIVKDSAIVSNHATSQGGAIRASGGGTESLLITGTTISSNTANHDGGGVFVFSVSGFPTTIAHSTITGNTTDADDNGSGIGGGLSVSLFPAVELDHTILAGNFNTVTTVRDDAAGTMSATQSLVGTNAGASITDNGGNQIGTAGAPIDALLGPLSDNGGPTPTHALSGDSPAIDAGAGPIAFYRFEETSGSNASDSVGNNDGTYNNGVSLGQSSALPGLGSAIQLDGVDDFIQLATPLSIGSSDNSVEVWAKVPLAGTSDLGLTERVGVILGNFDNSPNSNWEIDNSGQLRIWWNNGQLDLRGTTDLRDNQWHHLVFVRDTVAGEFRVYIDGREETLTAHASAGDNITFTTPHRIGNDNRAGAGIPFHGALDELAVYDRALTANEIAGHAAVGVPGNDQRGVPFVRFVDGDGDGVAEPDLGAVELQCFVIDTISDESDGDFSPGDYSLREAVEIANLLPGVDTITFDGSLAGQTITLSLGELAITDSMTIIGLGDDQLSIDGNNALRIMGLRQNSWVNSGASHNRMAA